MEDLSFEQIAEFVRAECQLRHDECIDPDTQFERDLGVTGDDGSDLLKAAEKHFGITLTRESFGLEPNEFLFGPEGSWNIFGELLSIFGKRHMATLRTFTVGELYDVVKKAVEEKSGKTL